MVSNHRGTKYLTYVTKPGYDFLAPWVLQCSVLPEAYIDKHDKPRQIVFSLARTKPSYISDTETRTEEEPGYITPEETSLIMEATEGTPLTQNMVEENPVIRTTPPIKTESLVKEITINVRGAGTRESS